MYKTHSKIRRNSGFTLIELVSVITLIGILAAFALPRMDTDAYHRAVFRERVLAALRYAQKTAISHRRPVKVKFSNLTTTALEIDSYRTRRFDVALNIPGTNSNQIISNNAVAGFSAIPASIIFEPNGTAKDDYTINFVGGTRITVVGATGYVY